MTDTKITPENADQFGPGTVVELNFGAYYPTFEGTVTRVEHMPASEWFPAESRLWVEYKNIDGEMSETTISRFSDRGIGTRLIRAVPTSAKKSPWAA